jgi:hypothetical protein
LGGWHHVGDLVVCQATADQDRPRALPRRVGVALGWIAEEAREDGKRRVLLLFIAAAARRDRAPRLEVTAFQRPDEFPQGGLEGAETDEQQTG